MATSSNVASRDTPFVAEAFARSINTAILFIDGDGNWKVGDIGQKVAQYKTVSASGASTVNDDTLELTALTAEKREGGGFLVYAQSNDDPSSYAEITLDGNGAVTGQRTLTLEQLFAAEVKYGIDLNDNGGIGSQLVLADDGQADLYIDGAGAYVVKTPKGDTIPLTLDGQPLTIYNLDDYEFSEVSVEDDGSLTSVVEDPSGNFFKVVSSASGSSTAPQPMTPEELAARESKSGVDVNRDSSKALTPDWTGVLKTPALRQEVEAQLVQGGKISHAGLLKIVDTVLQGLQASGATKVGADLVADLREMGARGQALFTSKDLAGNDTTYLSYVFDKMVNASKANNTFTGGQSKTVSLGNLSAESAPAQLAQLRDKWLLGKDLPNPTTQGDTANPNAAAATGLYQTFAADLFVGGANLLDVNQGSAGTCYLLAALAGVANSAPSALQSTFVSSGAVSGNRVWGVRFYDTAGKEVWVTANDQLVVSEPGADTASYAKATGRDASGSVVPELWVPLLEKAYAQANELGAFGRQNDANAMFAIEGGMAEAVSNVVGGRMTWLAQQAYSSINGNPLLSAITAPEGSSILAEVAKAINAGQVVWVGSDNKTTDASGATLWTGGHAFLALDPDPNNPNDTQIRVYNPWGFSAASAQSPSPSFVSPFLVDLASVAGVAGYDFYVQVWGSAKDDVIFGVEAGERLDGAEGNDALRGLGGNDTLLGGPGNDVISGGLGNDSIDGGEGDDVVTYPGDRSSYTITLDETGKITTITSTAEGTDTVVNVERFQFGSLAAAVSSSALSDKAAPSLTAANPLTGAKQVALEASLKFTFNEPIQLGKGAIVLKTADGKTVETFTAANATVLGNTLTLKPSAKFQVFTGYSVDFGSTAVQDLAGNSFNASQAYSLKSATVDGLYHFFVVAFAAAPGATYMGQLAEAVNYGLSLPQIVEIFTTKTQFTSVYPTTMSNRELATVLVNNIVKTSATEAARTGAINDIEAVLSPDIGWSRGKMLYTVFGNLASKTLTDPTWGGTAKQFQNQLAVARYFTEEMGVATENLATLRGVIGNVTPDTDVSTVEKIVQIIGTVPPGG
jgi:hypothetical protein